MCHLSVISGTGMRQGGGLMDRKRTVISPGAFIEMIKRTLLVMLGRRPVSGSYAADPDGVWQAIWASVVISVGIGVSLKMTVAVGNLVSYTLFELVQILAVVLVLNAIIRQRGLQPAACQFLVPFLWMVNVQSLFSAFALNSMVLTGDYTLGILFIALGAWSIYWMWRIGRDTLGQGGFFATGLLAVTYIIHLMLAIFQPLRVSIQIG
jgi:hypothetical protein